MTETDCSLRNVVFYLTKAVDIVQKVCQFRCETVFIIYGAPYTAIINWRIKNNYFLNHYLS
jgi:hypothetical protein